MSTLQERIAAIRERTMQALAPSLDTAPRKPRGKKSDKPEEVVPDVRELVTDDTVLTELEELAAEHQRFGRIQGGAKKSKDSVSLSIKKICNDYGLRKATIIGVPLNYYCVNRTSVDVDALRHALLAQGMTPTVIAKIVVACVTVTPNWTLRIGQGEDENE